MTALKSPSAAKTSPIEARCAATGMRMTEQRRVIARVLSGAEDHPDAEELYRRAAAREGRSAARARHQLGRLARRRRQSRHRARAPVLFAPT